MLGKLQTCGKISNYYLAIRVHDVCDNWKQKFWVVYVECFPFELRYTAKHC